MNVIGMVVGKVCTDRAPSRLKVVTLHHVWWDHEIALVAQPNDIVVELAVVARNLVSFSATAGFSFKFVAVVKLLIPPDPLAGKVSFLELVTIVTW